MFRAHFANTAKTRSVKKTTGACIQTPVGNHWGETSADTTCALKSKYSADTGIKSQVAEIEKK